MYDRYVCFRIEGINERKEDSFMIELKDVRKSYNGKVIFEDANLKLEDGTVTAFVGHNGCGKSTLLKVISGLVRKDCGEIIYDKKYRFSYVPEKFPIINMSARTYLKHMVEIDGIYLKTDGMDRINALAKDFYMENMLDKPMKNLSKGTLQKIGVMQAIMNNPEVLLLDEPLSGQDTDSQDVFIEKIKKLKKQGTIILLSAHEPDLIHSLGDKVYTIKDCKILRYENKPQTKYVIWMPEDNGMTPTTEMKKAENGYYVLSDEQMLSLEIKRLQKEGWQIGKVYEDY